MQRDFDSLRDGPFDLLVIGGGIYGSWAAFDAALKGYRVALIEKSDWAAGTSSSSSKLIHGGLRYLEQFNFRLVRHALEERRILTKIAPYQIDPVRFVIPVYKEDRVGPRMIKIGLSLYDRLAGGNQPVAPHQSFSADELAAAYPALEPRNLRGGFTYGDCQEDDGRLTLEVVASAQRAGAVTVNRAKATEIIFEKGRVNGAVVEDVETGESIDVRATVTINAAGPWARDLLGPRLKHSVPVRRIKGVHIVLPQMPEPRDAYLVTARSDNRVMFVIPWYDKTLVGTTEAEFKGDADDLVVTHNEMTYLLDECNSALTGLKWTPDDVLGCYAGVRTLIMDADSSANAASREFSIAQPADGLAMPVGGKYTTARRDAAQVLHKVRKQLPERKHNASTKTVPLAWSPGGDYGDWLKKARAQCVSLGMDERTAFWATKRHGGEIEQILAMIREDKKLATRLHPDAPFCRAEVLHAVRDEMARGLDDVLRRRMPLTLLCRPDRRAARDAAALIGPALGWNRAKQVAATDEFMNQWETQGSVQPAA